VVALAGKVHIETDLPDNTFVPIGFIAHILRETGRHREAESVGARARAMRAKGELSEN
jgi:hypothetical protein